jgi:predicted RNA polymerase sigma factor
VGTAWLYLGVGALLFRTVHLVILKGPQEALAWMSKILTDPLHDVYLYHKAPWQLLQGKRYATAAEVAAEAEVYLAKQTR